MAFVAAILLIVLPVGLGFGLGVAIRRVRWPSGRWLAFALVAVAGASLFGSIRDRASGLPMLAGWASLLRPIGGVGLVLAAWRFRHRILGTLPGAVFLVLAPLAFAFLFVPPNPFVPLAHVGFWDRISAGLLLGAGLLSGARDLGRRVHGRDLALGAVSVALGLVIVEFGARMVLPSPPGFPPPSAARLLVPRGTAASMDHKWLAPALYPERWPWFLERRVEQAGDARARVLHVGDSMVFGAGVELYQAFPARMHAMDPRWAHVNAGIPGTAPDFYYLLIRSWVDRVRPEAVVVYLFGSDFVDLDDPYACCDDGPLLTGGPAHPVPRCPEPVWGGSTTDFLPTGSPPPYPLRVATAFSFAARHLVGAWASWVLARPPLDMDAARTYQTALFRSLRDELSGKGVTLVMVLLPMRWDLEGDPSVAEWVPKYRAAFTSIAKELDIPILDPRAYFAGLVAQRGGTQGLFLDELPGNVHLASEGHHWLAVWLNQNLPPLLPPPPAPVAGGGP